MYVLINNGLIKQYPYSQTQLKKDNPNTSFPVVVSDDEMASHGAHRVFFTPAPPYDEATQVLVEVYPMYSSDEQRWVQVWEVRGMTPEQLAAAKQALIEAVTQQTQARLDEFAKTRNYDGILSACTYATSPTAKFAAEGQYCVEARDATWSALYTIMAEVEAGTRPMPSGYADIEPDLPVLVWPI